MKISLIKAGKRFNRDWIFRYFDYEFISGKSYAITGPNGSGKSTLLQVIAGAIALSEGTVHYLPNGTTPQILQGEDNNAYAYLTIAAPYLELIEEMTAEEFLNFHSEFKARLNHFSVPSILASVGLDQAAHKQIRYFSSGMKQRIKLAQAFFSDTPVILLDEPCTNLDADGIQIYQDLVNRHCHDRLVIVSSNDEMEYGFCNERISITSYKYPGN